MTEPVAEAGESVWQREEARCGAVLREVFAWLRPRELARCGAACRAWRCAAAAPALWRRALLRCAAPRAALDALRDCSDAAGVRWREEAVRALAEWRLLQRAPAGAGAALLHAALAPAGAALALAAADASLSVWQCDAAGRWHERWRASLRARGLAAAARVHWAGAAHRRRLLVAGPLALADDWELLVLDLHDGGEVTVASRARCSAGAAGCWADAGDAFLSLELRRLAPALALTTVWLNAATQETESEYLGVRTPLLRIFNENSEHITHVLVADAPLENEDADDTRSGFDDESPTPLAPGPEYYRATEGAAAVAYRVLVAGGGRRLGAWALSAARPPPLLAGGAGELRERARRRRERGAEPPAPPAEPDEAAVRALCTPPEHACRLPAPLLGLAPHPRSRCLWVALAGGAAECRALPALRALCRLAPPAPAPAPPFALHYVQPDVSLHYFTRPAGEYSSSVCVWSARVPSAPQRLAHAAPAAAALLPPAAPAAPGAPPALLVLAGDQLYVWRSRATPQSCD